MQSPPPPAEMSRTTTGRFDRRARTRAAIGVLGPYGEHHLRPGCRQRHPDDLRISAIVGGFGDHDLGTAGEGAKTSRGIAILAHGNNRGPRRHVGRAGRACRAAVQRRGPTHFVAGSMPRRFQSVEHGDQRLRTAWASWAMSTTQASSRNCQRPGSRTGGHRGDRGVTIELDAHRRHGLKRQIDKMWANRTGHRRIVERLGTRPNHRNDRCRGEVFPDFRVEVLPQDQRTTPATAARALLISRSQ